MALQFPPGFPEQYSIPVLGVEASARATLFATLEPLSRGDSRIKQACVVYVAAVVDSFALQALAAVREGQYRAAWLDASVEAFVSLALHQVYWGCAHPKIRVVTGDWGASRVQEELRPMVMAAPWHARYLASIPEVFASLQPRPTKPDPVATKANARFAFVKPLLDKAALTQSGWATKAGVDSSVVYDYLKGESNPRPETRDLLAQVLGLQGPDLPA